MKKRAVRSGGQHWTEDELRLLWALREAGLRGNEVNDALNKAGGYTGKELRTVRSVWNAASKGKKFKKLVTDGDRARAQTLLGHKSDTPTKRAYRKTLPEPALSPGAQKALEAKLALTATVRRFKLETPEASIEVAVSGKGAEAIFKKIVSAITILGK